MQLPPDLRGCADYPTLYQSLQGEQRADFLRQFSEYACHIAQNKLDEHQLYAQKNKINFGRFWGFEVWDLFDLHCVVNSETQSFHFSIGATNPKHLSAPVRREDENKAKKMNFFFSEILSKEPPYSDFTPNPFY